MTGCKGWLAFALFAVATTGAAQAEVLSLSGEFPARFREASLLHSVAVGRFEGQDGIALANAVERALSRTHFALMAGRTGRANAEAFLTGAVSSGVEENPYKRKEKRCIEKDKDGKCVKEAEVEIKCRTRIVSMRADLRMVRNEDGAVVYSDSKPFREETSWCEGGGPNRGVEDVVMAAVQQFATSVRYDIAPYRDNYQVRVRESSKGMGKDIARRFKNLIKLTKRDQAGACAGWDAMRDEAGTHPSLLFNLGLCAEQRGDYAGALALYRDASRAGASEGGEGAGRAQRLIAGREDAMARAGN